MKQMKKFYQIQNNKKLELKKKLKILIMILLQKIKDKKLLDKFKKNI